MEVCTKQHGSTILLFEFRIEDMIVRTSKEYIFYIYISYVRWIRYHTYACRSHGIDTYRTIRLGISFSRQKMFFTAESDLQWAGSVSASGWSSSGWTPAAGWSKKKGVLFQPAAGPIQRLGKSRQAAGKSHFFQPGNGLVLFQPAAGHPAAECFFRFEKKKVNNTFVKKKKKVFFEFGKKVRKIRKQISYTIVRS